MYIAKFQESSHLCCVALGIAAVFVAAAYGSETQHGRPQRRGWDWNGKRNEEWNLRDTMRYKR